MNPQTRSVLKAALIGLAVSIALTAASVVQEGRINPIDPYQIYNPEVIARWVGRIGFIPLIFAVGAVVYSIRKTALWVSVLNLVGAVVGISLVIAVGVVAVAATYPTEELPFATTGAERDAAVKEIVTTCVQKQRGLPENRTMSDAAINTFCSCYATSAADVIKREDIQYQAKHGTMSPEQRERLTTAYNKCAQNVRN